MKARIRWQALSAPVRSRLSVLLLLMGCILFWMVAIDPALKVLRHNSQRQLLTLQPGARPSSAPALTRDATWRALQSVTSGQNIQLTTQGDRVTAELRAVPAANLNQWLMHLRNQAQVTPSEVHLTRGNAAETTVWDGRVVVDLPSRDASLR